MQPTEIQIQVSAVRHNPSTDEVAGLYRVLIPASIEAHELADIAIESFHREIPVSSPEDYEIAIFDTLSGREIFPSYTEVGKVFGCKKYEEACA